MAEEYCWAITQAAGRSCGGRSDSSVLGVGFQLDSLVYSYMFEHMYPELRLALKFNLRLALLLRKPGSVCTSLVASERL